MQGSSSSSLDIILYQNPAHCLCGFFVPSSALRTSFLLRSYDYDGVRMMEQIKPRDCLGEAAASCLVLLRHQ